MSFPQLFSTLWLLVISFCCLQTAAAQFKPKDQQLFDTIKHVDALTFDAFNHQQIDKLKAFFAENVEFYNDGGGVSDYATTMANFQKMFVQAAMSGLRRELIESSLEVYPMPGYGAIEMGTHRFIHTENGKEEIGTMKFVNIWQLKDGQWKLTRVVSVGH